MLQGQVIFIQGEKLLKRTVESKKTFLVDGPASVAVVSGKVEVFGAKAGKFERIIIREGKRLPFYVKEKADFDFSLGTNGLATEVEGNTIPTSWIKLAEFLLTQKKPAVIMLIGKADSGKSSLCTYLLNKLVNGKKVAVLEGDMGQSDIGPPSTVSFAFSNKPVMQLYGLKMENAVFVGVTSPVRALAETINGLVQLKNELFKSCPDIVLVNTDGWVIGEAAVKFKVQLAEALKPTVVVSVEEKDELQPLLAHLTGTLTVKVEPSAYVSERSPDKRRLIRMRGFSKYLEDAKVRTFLLSKVIIEDKNALLAKKEEMKNLPIAFKDSFGRLLGIGVLLECNQKNIKILTPVSVKPKVIVLGQERVQ